MHAVCCCALLAQQAIWQVAPSKALHRRDVHSGQPFSAVVAATTAHARLVPAGVAAHAQTGGLRSRPLDIQARARQVQKRSGAVASCQPTWSSLALPPTSRKLAGEPPRSLMMSMVAMARPAPLTCGKAGS